MKPHLEIAARDLLVHVARTQGRVRFRVRGCSMRPFLRDGDCVEIQRQPMQDLRRGEIATFERAGAIIVHRVIGRQVQGAACAVITKGDAFPDADAPVQPNELLGRVVAIIRSGRRIAMDTAAQRTLGQAAAWVSTLAPLWYPGLRRVRHVLRFAAF